MMIGVAMAERKCPGQDLRCWKPEDIFETLCLHCGQAIEFFKDDLKRNCPSCGEQALNPNHDLSCAEWCKSAKECLGTPDVIAPNKHSTLLRLKQ
jgi:predicted RNA-binding Zn-ribbon protein involved in translation (DUF1610 family)